MRALAALVLLAGVAHADRVMVPEPESQSVRPRRVRPPAVPQVAPDIATLGAQLAGKYKCDGDTLVVSVALDHAWIEYRFAHAVEYRTYDAVAKQWTRIRLGGDGTAAMSRSFGPTDGAWTWSSTQGTEHETVADKSIAFEHARCSR